VLATGLFFVAAAGALYLALRPVTLRIAVGPEGSDDQRLVEALAEALTIGRSHVRLAPITTAGPVDSVALLRSKGPTLLSPGRLFRNASRCRFGGNYAEQGDLSALSLILEQFHLAVLERMFAIGATMPDYPRLHAR
jgi:hypothetical protein